MLMTIITPIDFTFTLSIILAITGGELHIPRLSGNNHANDCILIFYPILTISGSELFILPHL